VNFFNPALAADDGKEMETSTRASSRGQRKRHPLVALSVHVVLLEVEEMCALRIARSLVPRALPIADVVTDC
jgi:hypothetical protein